MKRLRRVFAVVLAICLAVTFLPSTIYAEGLFTNDSSESSVGTDVNSSYDKSLSKENDSDNKDSVNKDNTNKDNDNKDNELDNEDNKSSQDNQDDKDASVNSDSANIKPENINGDVSQAEDTSINSDNNTSSLKQPADFSGSFSDVQFPAFVPEPVIIDGVKINVKAPEGIFPAGAKLSVRKVGSLEKSVVENAVDKVSDKGERVAKSYTYDIKVLSADGKTELQPTDNNKVEVIFSQSEVSNVNLDTKIYHVTHNDSNNELEAKKLDMIDNDNIFDINTVTVESDGFSYYTVDFTYNAMKYVLSGETSVNLNEIINSVGLRGNVSNAASSNPLLFNVTNENDTWILHSYAPFDTTEKLSVTIDGIFYEISVTDDPNSVTVNSWAELKDAVKNYVEGTTIVLNSDVKSSGDSDDRLKINVGKNVVIDLNGHTIDRNRKKNSENGHVIEVFDGSLTINDSSNNNSGIITGGYADNGGGINIHKEAICTINGGRITGNYADVDGGAIFVRGHLVMTGGLIDGNSADDTAGAIYVTKEDSDSKIDISNVSITGNFADKGGALVLRVKHDSTITNCNISSNQAIDDVGGAIYCDKKNHTITLTGCTLNQNYADGDGGAIYINDGTIIMNGGKLNQNKSEDDSGAVKVEDDCTFKANNVEFDKNISNTEEGGAIKNFGEVELTSCTISNNFAQEEGGALWNDGEMTLDNCEITDNSSAKKGGAIYSDDELTIKGDTQGSNAGTIIKGNTTKGNGGGIFVGGSSDPVKIQGLLVVKENEAKDGNNIYLRDDCVLKMTGALEAGTDIWMAMEEETGTAVENYGTFHPVINPDDNFPTKYFHSDNNLGIKRGGKNDNDVVIYPGWKYVQKMIDNANDNGVVKLEADYRATSDDDRLKVKNGKSVTLDLNGHTLDRHLDDDDDDGHVIEVMDNSSLTIIDSSDSHIGKITGGYAENGGGINIQEGSSATINGGIIAGNKADNNGGGICNKGRLTIEGTDENPVVIENNYADNKGGGIYNIEGNATISLKNVVINNNSSRNEGGGIDLHMNADTTFDYCKIINNSSVKDDDNGGGGMRVTHADGKSYTLIIQNTEISNNKSENEGGGIFLSAGEINISSSKLIGNSTSDEGGGIYVAKNNNLKVEDCIISNNIASDEGGGICAVSNTKTTLNRSDIDGNTSKDDGGGFYNDGTAVINDCNITNNKAKGDGGGIANTASLTINGGNTTNHQIANNKSSDCGGAIYVGDDVTLNGTYDLSSNSASTAKGVYVSKGSKLKLGNDFDVENSRIQIAAADKNKKITSGKELISVEPTFTAASGYVLALDDGCLIIAYGYGDLQDDIDDTDDGDTLTLDRDYFSDGSDEDCLVIKEGKNIIIDLNGHTIDRRLKEEEDDGHVFYIEEDAKLTLKDSSGNNSGKIKGGFDDEGGGFFVEEDGELVIEGGTICDNNADVDGGAIYVEGKLTMKGGVIKDNYADDTAGAIYVEDDGKFNLYNVTITGNSSDDMGGAINTHSDYNTTIENCTITNNYANDYGGAIRYAGGDNTLTIKDSIIEGNSASDDGGAIQLSSGTIKMSGGSLSKNTSANDGGAVHITDDTEFIAKETSICSNVASTEEGGAFKAWGDLELTDCTIETNSASDDGGAIYVGDGSEVTIKNCKINGNKSSELGGGIANYGELYINGLDMQNNTSSDEGGGIFVDCDADAFKIKGKIIVKNNESNKKGNNCYSEVYLKLNGALLEGSEIVVECPDDTGRITTDYSDYNKNDDPNKFFVSESGYNVIKKKDEVFFDKNWNDLLKKIDKAKSGDTIVLDKDYMGDNDVDPLTVEDGKKITVDLNGHTINRNGNDDEKDGHVFLVEEKSTLTIIDSSPTQSGRITGGYAENGGAINIDEKSVVNFNSGTIEGNRASDTGGAVCVHEGTFNVNGGVITNNRADEGGAIFLCGKHMGKLNLSGGTINKNYASVKAGAIYADRGDGKYSAISISGAPIVKDNDCKKSSNDIYLKSGILINVVGKLSDGAKLVIDKENGEGQITNGYSTYNDKKEPSTYFSSTMGYAVNLISGEAVLGFNVQGETDKEKPFLDFGSQFQADYSALSSCNWMSGISGERYLNEINMPISHDSGMNNIQNYLFDWTTWVPGCFSQQLAKTQIEYIYEQMNDGYRKFDIRLNPVYKKIKFDKWYNPVPGYYWENDGKNLYICHGKTKFGTIMALDPDGDELSFTTVLDWATEFLRNNPTETIILDLDAELDIDYQTYEWEKETFDRAGRIITDYSRIKNPATGESYIYKEPDAESYLTPYTHMPQLKDCRGKIVIMTGNDHLKQTGGMSMSSVGIKKYGGQNYKISREEKIDETRQTYIKLQQAFDRTPDNPVLLRNDVGEMSDFYWSFGLNVTNQESDLEYFARRVFGWIGLTDYAPYQYAEYVNPRLFGEGNLFAAEGTTSKRGQYLGWVSMDGATAKYANEVWKTNFYEGMDENYCTITIDPSWYLEDDYPTQTYTLLKGTEITIPGNIYKDLDNKYLKCWLVFDGESWIPVGYLNPQDTYTVERDITIRPVFYKDGEVPVSIEWHDSNDADGLRDKNIDFTITPSISNNEANNEPYALTFRKSEDYRNTIKNATTVSIEPNWDKIIPTVENPYGTDTTRQYRYELVKDKLNGYIIKMYHTSYKKYSVTGEIKWVDNNNQGNTRPNRIIVELKEEGSDKVIATTEVVPNTDGRWIYKFDDVAKYKDGDEIKYNVTINDVDGYITYYDGLNVTNILESSCNSLSGFVMWDDSFNVNEKRPENIKLHLYANDTEVDSKELESRELSLYTFSFNNKPIEDEQGKEIDYSVTLDDVDGYTTAVEKSDNGTFAVYCKYNKPDVNLYKLTALSTDKEGKEMSNVSPKVSPKNISGIYDENTEITVNAPSEYGYNFIGWYEANEVDGEIDIYYDNPKSTNATYSFKIDSNTTLVAVYDLIYSDDMKPTAIRGLVANGTSQQLINLPLKPLPDGYTMKYAFSKGIIPPDDSEYTTDIPMGYSAGNYVIWYKPFGDDIHKDLKAELLLVEIEKGEETGSYEDVPVTPGEIKDISNTDEAPEETNPMNASVDNLEETLPISHNDLNLGVNVWIEVTDINDSVSEEDKALIASVSDGLDIDMYLDIKLFFKVGNFEPRKFEHSNCKIKVSFVVPEKYRQSGKKFKIVRIHDGVPSVLDADYNEETHVITFETDCLSTYALAYVVDKPTPEPTPPSPTPDSGDNVMPLNPDNTSSDVTTSQVDTVKVKAAKTKDSFPLDGEIITFICNYLSQMFCARGHL